MHLSYDFCKWLKKKSRFDHKLINTETSALLLVDV